MKVFCVQNVNQALQEGLEYIYQEGVREDSRAGPVLVSPCPVTTVYQCPQERVLFSKARDANPFLHLFESLWMLAGRNDATWLDQFVGDFSSRFAQPDGTLHGAYGFRWRRHFDLEGGGSAYLPDQLETIIQLLKKNPQDRQAVLSMWDPAADLGVEALRDRPCNTHVYFRVRKEPDFDIEVSPIVIVPHYKLVLDMTVCCRSNDLIWGAYGANSVHFSVLQEYLAARIGVHIGKYYQVSNNYHAYQDMLDKLEEKGILEEGYEKEYPAEVTPIVTHPEFFDRDLDNFFKGGIDYVNPFFKKVAVPLYWAHRNWKKKNIKSALFFLEQMPDCDWRLAAQQWMDRRLRMSQSKESAT
jgi:thymidylate synthase